MRPLHRSIGRSAYPLLGLVVVAGVAAAYLVIQSGNDPTGRGFGDPETELPPNKVALLTLSRAHLHVPHYTSTDLQKIFECLEAKLPRVPANALATGALAAQIEPNWQQLEELAKHSTIDASFGVFYRQDGVQSIWTVSDPTLAEIDADGTPGRQWLMAEKTQGLPPVLAEALEEVLPEGAEVPAKLVYYQVDAIATPDLELVRAGNYEWQTSDPAWELLPERELAFWGDHSFRSPNVVYLLDPTAGLPYRWDRHHGSNPADPAPTVSVQIAAMSFDQVIAWATEVLQTGVPSLPEGMAVIALEGEANDGELVIDSTRLAELGVGELGTAFVVVGVFTTTVFQDENADRLKTRIYSLNTDLTFNVVVNLEKITGQNAKALAAAINACQPK